MSAAVTRSMRVRLQLFLAALALACGLSAQAASRPAAQPEIVIVDAPQSATDKRNTYTDELLEEVLRRTRKQFGPYNLLHAQSYMERERLLVELKGGQLVNITAQATQPRWESSLIPLRIPVDLGLSSWRISLIRKESQAALRKITTLDELKQVPIGVGSAWSSLPVFQTADFPTTTSINYEGLFEMLMLGRFEHFPRGVNEVFVEYGDRVANHPDLAVESSFAIFFPFPKYFFVSPKSPKLAERIRVGLEGMVRDGSLRRKMLAFHADMIRRANFCSRRIFRIDNLFLSKETPLGNKELWFDPFDKVHGICKGAASSRSQ